METKKLLAPYEEEMIQIRRHIHANPELSNQEFDTTALIKEKLTEYGIELFDIGLKTGVIALLRGGKPGKTVAIREDIDALPMPELTGLPFASKKENICHSCGHDIHTTVLLYCAKVLSEIREELCGNVLFLFQPAEENGSGAQQFIDCNFTQVAKPDCFIGLHVSPLLPVGSIGLKKGPANASSDFFAIKITGKGGHGAHPEKFVDPVMISAYVLTQLQTVVSRECHPLQPSVLTIGSMHAGHAANIVADYAEMQGTLRTLDPDCRAQLKEAVTRIVEQTPASLRGQGEILWKSGMPPLVNDADLVDQAADAARKTIGADHIVMLSEPSMGSEDFSGFFPAYGPGLQFGLGTASDDPATQLGIHKSKNVFDEGSIIVGASVIVQFVRDRLK